MAARGPVILRDCVRSRSVSADIFCRRCECEWACCFMALEKSHRPFPKSSELQIVCRLYLNLQHKIREQSASVRILVAETKKRRSKTAATIENREFTDRKSTRLNSSHLGISYCA